jgi:hypothetical protein
LLQNEIWISCNRRHLGTAETNTLGDRKRVAVRFLLKYRLLPGDIARAADRRAEVFRRTHSFSFSEDFPARLV